MKIFVEYDSSGAVTSIGVPMTTPGESGSMRLVASPGRYVMEIDAPQVKSEHDHDKLLEIKSEYRVEASHRLVRKD